MLLLNFRIKILQEEGSMIPYYSLIVLAYNNWEFTKQCLTTLLESLDVVQLAKGVEIIVVDNGSKDETNQQMKRFRSKHKNHTAQLRYVRLKENLGYPSGINEGLKESKGEIIGVLNNDLLFPQNWLSPLAGLLESNPQIGFAAPFLSYAGGSIQHVGKTFDTIDEMEEFAAYFTNLNKDHMIYVPQVLGACLLFRRELLMTIGGNDFWYGIGNFDDVDWCIRAAAAGFKIAVVGGSFVHHIGHASFLHEPALFNLSLQINQDKFERKWKIKDNIHTKQSNSGKVIFDHNKHYIPIHLMDFNPLNSPCYPRTSTAKRILICADWSHPQSEWPSIIPSLMELNEQIELCCWIPNNLFDLKYLKNQWLACLSSFNFPSTQCTLRIFQDDMAHTDTLRVLYSTDAVAKISNDFVNRYIVHLAEQIGMKII
jgi:GT2 family glycosyltransferase